MKYSHIFGIAIVFAFSGATLGKQKAPREDLGDILSKAPEFYVLQWEPGTILERKDTDLFIEVDLMGRHEIVQLVNTHGQAVLFTSDVSTPVCADGECKLMHIRLYWTLLGEYAGFDRYPDLPLTKHDHDEFGMEDYLKLHNLLKDDKSILKRRTVDQLVEKPKQRIVNGVDALSGATIAEVKESVVSGALYSCYLTWHLVHGQAKQEIKEYMKTRISDEIIINMLHSDNSEYQLFALEELSEAKYREYYVRIAEVFKTSIPLIRGFIAKNLPEEFWNTPRLQEPFWSALEDIDIGSRSLLLKHLEDASSSEIEKISGKLKILTKNQLKLFLDSISDKEHSIVLLKNLNGFSGSNETYSYLAQQFLEDLKP